MPTFGHTVALGYGEGDLWRLVTSTNPLPVTMPAGVGINSPIQSYAPGYMVNPGGTQNPTTDAMGYTQIRGPVMTDEGNFRANFVNSSLAVSIGTATFTNGSDVVTGSGFASDPIRLGDYIKLDADDESAWKQIDSFDDTTIYLRSAYTVAGVTIVGVN